MASLPTKYMRVARNLTGYWGAYPPSAQMEPGMIGRSVDGVFVREGHLKTKPGWDANRLKIEKQRNFEAVTTWTTHNVAMTVVGAHVNAPGGAANGAVRVRFGGADEAVIICNGPLLWSFTDQDAVRGFMRELFDGGQWKDVGLCVVTEVILVDFSVGLFRHRKKPERRNPCEERRLAACHSRRSVEGGRGERQPGRNDDKRKIGGLLRHGRSGRIAVVPRHKIYEQMVGRRQRQYRIHEGNRRRRVGFRGARVRLSEALRPRRPTIAMDRASRRR